MTMLKPVSTINLSAGLYDLPTLDWSTIEAAVTAAADGPHHSWFLGTIRPDGRPHSNGIGHVWLDGHIYFATGPNVQKTRNLLADPRCTVSATLETYDVVFDGAAARVTNPEQLAAVVSRYNAAGWPATVDGDAITAPYSAPSAGPAPWHLYRVTIHSAVALTTRGKENGATKWQFR